MPSQHGSKLLHSEFGVGTLARVKKCMGKLLYCVPSNGQVRVKNADSAVAIQK
jgi:hypothetical protein